MSVYASVRPAYKINNQQMKRVLYYLIPFVLLTVITVVEIQAQNENVPASAQSSKRSRKSREKPEQALVKKKPIPARNIKTTGNWMSSAVAFDDVNKGTSISNPIEIASAEQLAYLAKQVKEGNNYAGKHFKLMADINLNGREWTPIGTSDAFDAFDADNVNNDDHSLRFCGSFHGDGHKIEKMAITKGGDYSGLFGACGTGSHIEKLHIVDCYVRGRMIVGGMVGELVNGSVSDCSVSGNVIASNECVGGIVGINNGTIVNSQTSVTVFGNSSDTGGLAGASGDRMPGVVDHCKATGTVSGYWNVGGLIGRNNGVVSNSQASGDVIGEEWVGGLIGWTDKGMVSFCQASGNVNGFFDVGGLVGFNGYLKSTVQINNSHATGKVIGSGSGNYCIGGLAGYSGGIITDCHATGVVDGEESVGGLVGEHGGKTINSYATGDVRGSFDTGGLIGFNGFPGSQAIVENCYASGTVTGYRVNNYGIGGLIGYSGGNVSRCYSTGSTSGEDAVGGLIGEQEGTLTNCYATGTVTAKITAGGLTGWNWMKISSCFAIGFVNCNGIAGGLIGQNQDKDAVVKNSYFDWQSTKQPKGVGQNNNERSTLVKPLPTEELKNGSFPQGFEATVWEAAEGQYPKLKAIHVKPENL